MVQIAFFVKIIVLSLLSKKKLNIFYTGYQGTCYINNIHK